MLATRTQLSWLRVIAVAASYAVLALSIVTIDVNKANGETCLFVTQLASDPILREEYLAKISVWTLTEEEPETDTSDLYETSLESVPRTYADTGSFEDLDSFSRDCLSCHDGTIAQTFTVRYKNDPSGRPMSMIDIIGGHPVGMEYDRYLSAKPMDYRAEARTSYGMIYAYGKIGCITCHNPLNTDLGHLVMVNERSELCFACHVK